MKKLLFLVIIILGLMPQLRAQATICDEIYRSLTNKDVHYYSLPFSNSTNGNFTIALQKDFFNDFPYQPVTEIKFEVYAQKKIKSSLNLKVTFEDNDELNFTNEFLTYEGLSSTWINNIYITINDDEMHKLKTKKILSFTINNHVINNLPANFTAKIISYATCLDAIKTKDH